MHTNRVPGNNDISNARGGRVPYPCGRLGNCLIEMKAGEEVGHTETPSASAAATP
jgi:hypothetical protein